MGRKRICDASTVASRILLPAERPCRAISMMSMAFLADSAMSRTRPICTYRLLATPRASQRTYRSKQGERDGKNDGSRSYPTFVLSSEHEIDQK